MNAAVRRFCQGIPILSNLYPIARNIYHRGRFSKAAKDYFVNCNDYLEALEKEDGKVVVLQTKDGLNITIRRNCMDAAILTEVFLDRCYVRGLILPDRPTVVDIGGYIGDFALYSAKCLNAREVVVCEPSPSNWALLTKNVSDNGYESRIKSVNMAVTDGQDVMMNIDAPSRGQARVSAYGDTVLGRKCIQGITLARLVEDHGLEVIDLLKIDCEGGEYAILSTTPTEVFRRVKNIVFEYHEIDGFKARLEEVKRRLCAEGYSLKTRGSLIAASRG